MSSVLWATDAFCVLSSAVTSGARVLTWPVVGPAPLLGAEILPESWQ